MSNADEYRKQAEDARQMAARSLKEEDKAFWLRLAEDWLKLPKKPISHPSGDSPVPSQPPGPFDYGANFNLRHYRVAGDLDSGCYSAPPSRP
jgi:hypothetical protein